MLKGSADLTGLTGVLDGIDGGIGTIGTPIGFGVFGYRLLRFEKKKHPKTGDYTLYWRIRPYIHTHITAMSLRS